MKGGGATAPSRGRGNFQQKIIRDKIPPSADLNTVKECQEICIKNAPYCGITTVRSAGWGGYLPPLVIIGVLPNYRPSSPNGQGGSNQDCNSKNISCLGNSGDVGDGGYVCRIECSDCPVVSTTQCCENFCFNIRVWFPKNIIRKFE